MPEPHPLTLLEPEELEARVREAFGIPDELPVPQHIYEKLDSITSRPFNQVTENMRLGNISRRFRDAGVSDSDNIARNMLRDKGIPDFNLSIIEGLTPARGYVAEMGGIVKNTLVTGSAHLGVNISQSLLKAWEFGTGEGRHADLTKTLVRARFGIDLDNVWSPTGRKEDALGWNIETLGMQGGLPIYHDLGQVERAYGDGTISKVTDVLYEGLEENDEYLMGLMAQHERAMMGKVGAWRKGSRFVTETAAGISQFVIAGAASTITTGTPLPGIHALVLAHANSTGHEIYSETGRLDQAALAAALNYGTTIALFGVAHGATTRMTGGMKRFFGAKPTAKEMEMLGAKFQRGDISGVMHWVRGAAKIEMSAMALRDMEWTLNATYQHHFGGDVIAERFQFSWDNLWATTGHAAQEGAIFVLMPTIVPTATGFVGRAERLNAQAMFKGEQSFRALSKKVKETSVAEAERLVADFELNNPNQANPVIQLELELLRNMMKEKRGEEINIERSRELAVEIGAAENKQQAKWHTEAHATLEMVVSKGNQSSKPVVPTKSDPSGHRNSNKQRVVTNEERINNSEREAIADVVDRVKRVKGAEEELKPGEKAFAVEAMDRAADGKIVKFTVNGKNASAVGSNIRQMGYFPISVRAKAPAEKAKKKKPRTIEEITEPKELTPEEVKKLEEARPVDSDALVLDAVYDTTGEALINLRSKVELLKEKYGDPTTKESAELEVYEQALRTAEILIEGITGIRPKAGPLPSPRMTKVGETEYDNEAAATLLRRTGEKHVAERDALAEQLKKDNPEWKDKTARQLAKELTEEHIESRAVIERGRERGEPLTAAERKQAMKLREEIASENTLNSAKDGAYRAAKKAIEVAQKLHRKLKRGIAGREKEFSKSWRRFVVDIKKAFKGIDTKVVAKIEKLVKGKDEKGKPVVKSQEQLEAAIIKATELIEAETATSAGRRIKKGLGRRKKETYTRLTTMLDRVLTSIKKVITPDWKEGGDYVEAITEYSKKIAEMAGDTVENAVAQAENIISIIRKVEVGGMDALNLLQKLELANFIEALHNENAAMTEIRWARQQAKVELDAEILLEEIVSSRGYDLELGYDRVDGHRTANDSFIEFIKFIGYGMAENGRLTDAVEYISGGTNTRAYKILVTDVLTGDSNARFAGMKLQHGLEKMYEKHGITEADLKAVSESQASNYWQNKKYKPALEIETYDGKKIEISRGELVGFLLQAKDSETLALWVEGNAGIRFRGRPKPIRGEEQARIVEDIIERSEGTLEARIAEAIAEYINSEFPVEMIRRTGLRLKGKDIIQERAEGDRHVPRKRHFEKEGKVETETDPERMYDAMEGNSIFDKGPTLDTSSVEARQKTAKYDIIVGDGQFTINTWFRQISNLAHAEESMTHAQNVLGHPTIRKAGEAHQYDRSKLLGSGAQVTSKLLGSINKNFYVAKLKVERGLVRESNVVDTWLRKVRNNLVKSGLSLNPAIPVYQALSLIAASYHMGHGGKRAIISAMFDMVSGGENGYSAVYERMIQNSGLAYDRMVTGNAQSISTGEIAQGKQATSVLGAKKVRATAKGGISGKLERGIDFGMKGIEKVDHFAVISLYRATEIQVAARWSARGKGVKKNQEVYDELVRREFEANLIETQPSFDPLHQPALINKARESTLISFYTMYKGYTGKLVSMQRRALMRAERARRQGNHTEALQHLQYGAAMTLYGSAMIPFIRNGVKMTLAGLATEILEELGITDDIDKTMGENGLEWFERSALQEGGQLIGMTGLGGIFEEAVNAFVFDTPIQQGTTPYHQALGEMFRATNNFFTARKDAPYMTQTKRSLQMMRPTLGMGFGVPGTLFTYPLDVIREFEDGKREQAEEDSRSIFGTR